METSITPGWRFVSIGLEGHRASLQGVNPWRHKWIRIQGQPITVAHPGYPRECHTIFVYDLDAPGKRIRFAAGEFSNGV